MLGVQKHLKAKRALIENNTITILFRPTQQNERIK